MDASKSSTEKASKKGLASHPGAGAGQGWFPFKEHPRMGEGTPYLHEKGTVADMTLVKSGLAHPLKLET